ncbi:beta-lactamase class D [Paraburkholderia sp. GAS448]|uniref:class D beta-lactamase n=1 Tax=Paraburkholderia sp. GAS448 TaxID=3035136 RepID=UPI003D239BA0
MYLRRVILCLFFSGLAASAAEARTVCTAIADAKTGKILLQQGNCTERVTPASTFKIAISLMGYDSGFLKDEHTPTLPYREGYVDWGGEAWKQPTDPTRWLKYSVVWFSQQVTHALGSERFAQYAKKFNYGNADVSGDPGKHNGLDRSWIASSLKISPLEQIAFLQKFVDRQLPVSPTAFDMTNRIVESTTLPDDWTVHGKTGMAYPREPDGTFDEAHPHGWFVGWATKGDDTLVFARLIQDDKKESGTAGVRARDAFLNELPSLVGHYRPKSRT